MTPQRTSHYRYSAAREAAGGGDQGRGDRAGGEAAWDDNTQPETAGTQPAMPATTVTAPKPRTTVLARQAAGRHVVAASIDGQPGTKS